MQQLQDAVFEQMRQEGWEAQTDEGFIELVGPLWRFKSTEVDRYAFWALSRHKNRRGVVQGGMLMTLADRAMGATARRNEPDIAQATVQMNMNFLDAARIGERVEIECWIDRRTRSLVFVSGRLTQEERIVGTSSGVWKVLGQ